MRLLLFCAVLAAMATTAAAQERPFLFSVATSEDAKPAVRFDYDVGVGERAFQSDIANQPEQRIGPQAGPSLHISPVGRRWQFTATGGPVFHSSDTGRSSGGLRDLPPETQRASYAFKVSLSIGLFSGLPANSLRPDAFISSRPGDEREKRSLRDRFKLGKAGCRRH
jgi:hypothetical protein